MVFLIMLIIFTTRTEIMILKYTSPELGVSFKEKFISSRAILEHNIIFDEEYDSKLDKYRLSLSVDIKTNEDLNAYKDIFKELIKRINISLIYVTLQAIDSPPCNYNYDKREYTLLDFSNIYEWKSNFNNIWNIFNKNKIHFLSETYHITYSATESPFEDILHLIDSECIIHKKEIYKELVYWHRESLLVNGDIRLLIISKALEVLRTLLPDFKNDSSSIPKEINNIFEAYGRDINWLYNMSNNRRETRHAVLHGKPIPKERMTNEEYTQFITLSNILIINWIRHAVGLKCHTYSNE